MNRRRFELVFGGLVVLGLFGCSPSRPTIGLDSSHARASVGPYETGADVERHLNARYRDATERCNNGSPTAPAFLCSGILVRATKYSGEYHSWIPNPDTAPFGISFSWVRFDANMWGTFPTSHGFIAYPREYSDPKQLKPLIVRCVYVHDSWSAGPDRCTWHENQSGNVSWMPECQDLSPPVLTGDQWVARASPRSKQAAQSDDQPARPAFDDDENQCAFGVERTRSNTAAAWMAFVRARYLLHTRHRNEVIVDDWTKEVGGDEGLVPIEAFFYGTIKADPSEPDPVGEARKDQLRFKQITGRWVPVIRWEQSRSGDQTFLFRTQDQAIPQ